MNFLRILESWNLSQSKFQHFMVHVMLGLGGGFKYVYVHPEIGEDESILTNIFQMD